MQWEKIGVGPTDDTTTVRATVAGGWLYAVVATQPVRRVGEEEHSDCATILALTFVPGRRNPAPIPAPGAK